MRVYPNKDYIPPPHFGLSFNDEGQPVGIVFYSDGKAIAEFGPNAMPNLIQLAAAVLMAHRPLPKVN